MLITDTVTIRGTEYKRCYSNKGFLIERNGVKYSEAIDSIDSNYTYTETTEYIDNTENATEYDLLKSLESLGVEV